MKKPLMIMLLCIMPCVQVMGLEARASDESVVRRRPGPDEVRIGRNCITVPLGRLILVRKGPEYCAVTFTEAWTGKTEEYWYGRYEAYYQGDGTGDFSNKNVEFRKRKLSSGPPWAWGGFHSARGNPFVSCGPIRLIWSIKSTLYFSEDPGRPGVELAPTKWTDISQVSVFDPRLKWYRYDENRKDMYIPIDQLWENDVDKK